MMVIFLPNLSEIGPIIIDPRAAPIIARDTMVSFSKFVIDLKSFSKYKFAPPMIPVSYLHFFH
jgi:hypothetical protein